MKDKIKEIIYAILTLIAFILLMMLIIDLGALYNIPN